MILGFPRAKQGLCHTKHGEVGGSNFVSIAHSISSLFMLSFILKTYAMEDVAHTVGVFRAREFEGMGEIYSLLLWKCFWSFYQSN